MSEQTSTPGVHKKMRTVNEKWRGGEPKKEENMEGWGGKVNTCYVG